MLRLLLAGIRWSYSWSVESRFMGLSRLEANLFSLSRRLVIWIPLRAINTIMSSLQALHISEQEKQASMW